MKNKIHLEEDDVPKKQVKYQEDLPRRRRDTKNKEIYHTMKKNIYHEEHDICTKKKKIYQEEKDIPRIKIYTSKKKIYLEVEDLPRKRYTKRKKKRYQVKRDIP